ncbi:MAG: phage tail protein [Prevotellaceae bacterium]|jgi:phage protein U|nr:phage tail protein [Prevotellaceae bacterium]
MFAQLGKHIFQGLKAPHAWGETNAARYGKISLINGKDIIQYTGEDLSEIDLSLRYSVEFCDPAEEITALKQSMKLSKILPFIGGDGTVIGNFVITGIEVTNEKFSPTGQMEAATVSLKLLEYAYGKKIKVVKNRANTSATTAAPAIEPMPELSEQQTGMALESASPVIEPPAVAVLSPANEIAKDLSKGAKLVAKAKKIAADAKKGINTAAQAVHEVRKVANSAKQLYTTVKNKVENTVKLAERLSDLPGSLDETISYAENLSRVDNLTDTSVLQNNVNQLSESADKVKDASARVIAFSATREK